MCYAPQKLDKIFGCITLSRVVNVSYFVIRLYIISGRKVLYFLLKLNLSYNILFSLLAFEGEKSRDSCALNSGCKKSLVCSARTAHSAGKDFTAFRDEFFQTVYIFVIDLIKLFLAECAYLFTGRFFEYLFNRCFFFHDYSPYVFVLFPFLRREYPSRRPLLRERVYALQRLLWGRVPFHQRNRLQPSALKIPRLVR